MGALSDIFGAAKDKQFWSDTGENAQNLMRTVAGLPGQAVRAVAGRIGEFADDPISDIKNTVGKASADMDAVAMLQTRAFGDPRNPARVTDQAAFNELTDKYMNSVMNFAPAGIHLPHTPLKPGAGVGNRYVGAAPILAH